MANDNERVSYRKIDNGYIICRDKQGPGGMYEYTEEYVPKEPKITFEQPKQPGNVMTAAKKNWDKRK